MGLCLVHEPTNLPTARAAYVTRPRRRDGHQPFTIRRHHRPLRRLIGGDDRRPAAARGFSETRRTPLPFLGSLELTVAASARATTKHSTSPTLASPFVGMKHRSSRMLGSGFIEFKLDYEEIHHLAIGDVVTSENFSAGGYLWRINCYPRGYEIHGDNEHVSIYLQMVTKSKNNVKVIFDASVVCSDGTFFSSNAVRSVDIYSPREDIDQGWKCFVKRSDLDSSYVINGTVTFLCGVIVVPDIDNTLPVLPQPDLASHLGHLLDSALGTDVSFVVGGEVFPAHRAVLAARSPVFSAELFGPMADATMPSITLHDIEPAAFRVMLQFMYTDALPSDDELGDPLTEMLIHLLVAADRYALDRLKVICELKLCENVSVETVASVLACAETYGCLKLKTKCMDLFAVKENFKKAVVTDGFIMLLQKFPILAAELAGRVALQNA